MGLWAICAKTVLISEKGMERKLGVESAERNGQGGCCILQRCLSCNRQSDRLDEKHSIVDFLNTNVTNFKKIAANVGEWFPADASDTSFLFW